ncbi:MAG: hypothetical protein KF773_39790, partial [Deltaproteobacteria bacterium]|nr:hypothetical protein [Deltaproteobacteria bacterium]
RIQRSPTAWPSSATSSTDRNVDRARDSGRPRKPNISQAKQHLDWDLGRLALIRAELGRRHHANAAPASDPGPAIGTDLS